MAKTRIYSMLTCAGALPFMACALMALLGMSSIKLIGAVLRIE